MSKKQPGHNSALTLVAAIISLINLAPLLVSICHLLIFSKKSIGDNTIAILSFTMNFTLMLWATIRFYQRRRWAMIMITLSQIANIIGYAYILLESPHYSQEQPSNNTLLTVLFMVLSMINLYLILKPSTQCLFVKNMPRSIPSFLKTLGQIANRLQSMMKPEKPASANA